MSEPRLLRTETTAVTVWGRFLRPFCANGRCGSCPQATSASTTTCRGCRCAHRQGGGGRGVRCAPNVCSQGRRGEGGKQMEQPAGPARRAATCRPPQRQSVQVQKQLPPLARRGRVRRTTWRLRACGKVGANASLGAKAAASLVRWSSAQDNVEIAGVWLGQRSRLLHWAMHGRLCHTLHFLMMLLVVAFSPAWDQVRCAVLRCACCCGAPTPHRALPGSARVCHAPPRTLPSRLLASHGCVWRLGAGQAARLRRAIPSKQ